MIDSGSRSSVKACFVAQPTRHTTGSTKIAICSSRKRLLELQIYDVALSREQLPAQPTTTHCDSHFNRSAMVLVVILVLLLLAVPINISSGKAAAL